MSSTVKTYHLRRLAWREPRRSLQWRIRIRNHHLRTQFFVNTNSQDPIDASSSERARSDCQPRT